MRLSLLILALFSSCCCAFKILVCIPMFGYSHVQTMGRLADILVEQGHEVTFLMPIANEAAGNGTKLAKVVLVPPNEEVVAFNKEAAKSGVVAQLWTHSANSKQGIMWSTDFIGITSYLNTKLMLNDAKLIDSMKNEKFDIGLTELFDFSGVAFFHAIDLKNVIGVHTTSVFEGTLLATGAPILPSFVPGSQTFTDDSGSILSRVYNIYMTYWSYKFQDKLLGYVQKAVDEHFGKKLAPNLWDLVSDITWFFVNSDPIFDFPKPIPHNIVEIAGISVSKTKPLDDYWNSVMNRRQKTVLVSFGSIASPNTMPENVKSSIFDTFRAFPDVTFVLKFDDSQNPIGIENVVTAKWMPQNDLLADPRLSLFWTHGGMGSLMESAQKGVPLVIVPIFGDQMRNAEIAKRHGAAVIYDKMDLAKTPKLIATIREALENPSYKQSAVLLAEILATERVSPQEKIRDVINFAGKFGPQKRWTSASKSFTLSKYFNIDLVVYGVILTCMFVISLLIFVRWIFAQIFSVKPKNE
ncbi:unnamed protein product [Caenorhabditis angaria]|uniref:glucuronosyltransferase n=1 Tax=Caenorhabditis angaria TaxID=860376 RepID=A0A9P1N3F7_9PELO|nr:unnamed protein product [Caenorhabditis angaria]